MPEPEPERPPDDDNDPAGREHHADDVTADARAALRDLQEAIESSRELSLMIADLEQKLAELKTRPAQAESECSEAVGESDLGDHQGD